jgi:hypothetical protein
MFPWHVKCSKKFDFCLSNIIVRKRMPKPKFKYVWSLIHICPLIVGQGKQIGFSNSFEYSRISHRVTTFQLQISGIIIICEGYIKSCYSTLAYS